MMRIDAGVNPRAAGPALAPDGAAGQYGAAATPAATPATNGAGNGAGAIRITPSRRIVERRDPAISFKVTAAGFSAFDILLTTDPAQFEARNADRRTAANFRSSRQDFDGESIPAEIGFYMTPTAFLGALAAARPRPERLYYVAVGYRGDERTSGVFSTPAETLADLAPYVQLAANLLADYLSSGQNGHVFEHCLAAVAEPRGLDCQNTECSAKLVDYQGSQGLSIDILSNDQQVLADLKNLLQRRKNVCHSRDLLVGDQNVWIV